MFGYLFLGFMIPLTCAVVVVVVVDVVVVVVVVYWKQASKEMISTSWPFDLE